MPPIRRPTTIRAAPRPSRPSEDVSLSDVAISATVVAGLLDASADGMLLIDGTGTLLLVNTRIEQMFGYTRGELLGQPVETLLPEASRAAHVHYREQYASEPRLRPMGIGLQLQGRRQDGTQFPVEISLSPLTNHIGQWAVAAVRDATAQRAASQELQERLLGEEQTRIAESLADTVIGGLFGAGLRLQGLVDRVPEPVRTQLQETINGIDAIIRDIRTTIFGLRSRAHDPTA